MPSSFSLFKPPVTDSGFDHFPLSSFLDSKISDGFAPVMPLSSSLVASFLVDVKYKVLYWSPHKVGEKSALLELKVSCFFHLVLLLQNIFTFCENVIKATHPFWL